MIGIIDYGLGNVRAFESIYRRLGVPVMLVTDAAAIDAATHLILPGVGSFDWAMERLTASGMLHALNRRVLQEHVPVLGVCVGMQIMARRSEEGSRPGLGWIAADVRRFNSDRFDKSAQIPHMGWNDVAPQNGARLFDGIADPLYYFLHSYYLIVDKDEHVIGQTDYGGTFAAAVQSGRIFATQFHPEKSHDWGIRLLRNFGET